MLISAPFLSNGTTEDNTDRIQFAYSGQYPVTSRLEWHNGQHLVAPQDANGYAEVRAIADGKVIYVDQPNAAPSADKTHPQNYATFGPSPEWTDKGMVIIEHTTEIGATRNTPTTITFYSVYAHLKEIAAGVATGKAIYRKDIIGKPGQIYGEAGHLHFEICLDDANIKLLLGKDPANWPAADAAPIADGRTDAVFGNTYIYLPSGTPTQVTAPATHLHGTAMQTLAAAQWVQIEYAGNAKLVSYTIKGDVIAERIDADAEYELYKEANKRHDSLSTADKATSSPSGWYELLRFGRNLGRGTAATDKDPLPANAAHWRKIQTPTGELWADLNAEGTFKFSDADFPAFLGWDCFGDDTRTADQRCDSAKLKRLLTSEIDDPAAKQIALADPIQMFAYTRNIRIKPKLRRAICKFSSEFDQNNFEARYGHIKETEYFKDDTTGKSWELLKAHIEALTKSDLPQKYKDAQWHLHPMAFVAQMRRCGWLGRDDLFRILVSAPSVVQSRSEVLRSPMNRVLRKYGISNSRQRVAHFLAQVGHETGWWQFREELGNERYFRTMYEVITQQEATEDFRSGLAQRLGQVRTGETALAYGARRPNAVAQKAATMDNGQANAQVGGRAGDGPRFRGRGFLQITGRRNYTGYGKYRGQDFTTDPNPLLLATDSFNSCDASGFYWVRERASHEADQGVATVNTSRVGGIINRGSASKAPLHDQERRGIFLVMWEKLNDKI